MHFNWEVKLRKLRIGTFVKADGEHIAAWRHPATSSKGGVSFQSILETAKIAEKGKLDFLFMGDVGANADLPAELLRHCSWLDKMEPLSVLTALASATKHIGLVGTATTTYNDPYSLARRLATIDHISAGRAGWNVVTSMNHTDALNYGTRAHDKSEERYARAAEFVSVVCGLWDSWKDDDLVRNKESGVYFNATALPYLNHSGKYFTVRGPLDQARPPQGHPVIVQAGASDEGRELAAQTADVVFVSQQDLAGAQSFYADIKKRANRYGRADQILVLAGLQPVIGQSDEEAHSKYEYLQNLLNPGVALAMLTTLLGGVDLTKYRGDEPITEEFITNLPPAIGLSSRRESLLRLAQRDGLTVHQLAIRMAGSRGHKTVIGTPDKIADHMESWFTARGADGFLLLPPVGPSSLQDFVDLVIPILRSRGLFRSEYEGATLRENLGLSVPVAAADGRQNADRAL